MLVLYMGMCTVRTVQYQQYKKTHQAVSVAWLVVVWGKAGLVGPSPPLSTSWTAAPTQWSQWIPPSRPLSPAVVGLRPVSLPPNADEVELVGWHLHSI